jgi:hypothetical protein
LLIDFHSDFKSRGKMSRYSPNSFNLSWFVTKRVDLVYDLGGDIDPACIDDFCVDVSKIPGGSTLDMSELEIYDGPSLAVLITSLRSIAPCTIIEAPRMLAHTVYKIDAQTITLLHPRSY